MSKIAPRLRFAHLAPEVWKALGELPRTDWVRRGVKKPETVQEHTITLRNIACSIEGLRRDEIKKLLDMFEVHDWPEAINGDPVILTFDEEEKKRLKASKFEQEREVMNIICGKLGIAGHEINNLWLCFETSQIDIAVLAR